MLCCGWTEEEKPEARRRSGGRRGAGGSRREGPELGRSGVRGAAGGLKGRVFPGGWEKGNGGSEEGRKAW